MVEKKGLVPKMWGKPKKNFGKVEIPPFFGVTLVPFRLSKTRIYFHLNFVFFFAFFKEIKWIRECAV